MEKQASNTFVGGLITDRHPLASQNTELIDAQNIDLLAVGEGYQMILQKREGNEEVALGSLPTDYIPLAVKEFNNIAYIISLAPDGDGELGTFPSPDYTKFEYVTENDTFDGINLTWEGYDPTADSVAYDFTISKATAALVSVPGTGAAPYTAVGDTSTDIIAHGGLPVFLGDYDTKFTLTNTGAQPDTYLITMTGDTTNVVIYAGAIAYNSTYGVSLEPGAAIDIDFQVIDPFLFVPNVTKSIVATITPVNGSISSAETFSFSFKTTYVLQVVLMGITTPISPKYWYTVGGTDILPASEITPVYLYRSNVVGHSVALSTITPAVGITATEAPAHQINVHATANGGGARTAKFRLTETTAGAVDITVTQLAP